MIVALTPDADVTPGTCVDCLGQYGHETITTCEACSMELCAVCVVEHGTDDLCVGCAQHRVAA